MTPKVDKEKVTLNQEILFSHLQFLHLIQQRIIIHPPCIPRIAPQRKSVCRVRNLENFLQVSLCEYATCQRGIYQQPLSFQQESRKQSTSDKFEKSYCNTVKYCKN